MITKKLLTGQSVFNVNLLYDNKLHIYDCKNRICDNNIPPSKILLNKKGISLSLSNLKIAKFRNYSYGIFIGNIDVTSDEFPNGNLIQCKDVAFYDPSSVMEYLSQKNFDYDLDDINLPNLEECVSDAVSLCKFHTDILRKKFSLPLFSGSIEDVLITEMKLVPSIDYSFSDFTLPNNKMKGNYLYIKDGVRIEFYDLEKGKINGLLNGLIKLHSIQDGQHIRELFSIQKDNKGLMPFFDAKETLDYLTKSFSSSTRNYFNITFKPHLEKAMIKFKEYAQKYDKRDFLESISLNDKFNLQQIGMYLNSAISYAAGFSSINAYNLGSPENNHLADIIYKADQELYMGIHGRKPDIEFLLN